MFEEISLQSYLCLIAMFTDKLLGKRGDNTHRLKKFGLGSSGGTCGISE